MAFYPFTLPLTTGPGAIAVSVAVSTSLPRDLGHIAGTFVATVATVAVIWVCYRYSDRLNKAVGVAGADALARIFAFILICLGVAIFWQGLLRTLAGAQRAGDGRRSCGQVSIRADDGRALLLDI